MLLSAGILLALCIVPGSAGAEDTGTLRGVVTIVGQENLRDGEVVVSYSGTSQEAGNAAFNSSEPEYTLDLPPGAYSVYAWAPVFHPSSRISFTIDANRTTWVNLTVVRLEEVMGIVSTPGGEPVEDATVQLRYLNGTLLAATETDSEGRYRDSLDPGEYDLVVTKAGFEDETQRISVGPGQVVTLDVSLVPLPEEVDEGGLSTVTVGVLLFVIIAVCLSLMFVGRQARRLRLAKLEAEASRAREMACPACGALMPDGRTVCPGCGHVLQVRCSECGRSMDAGAVECPECGAPVEGS